MIAAPSADADPPRPGISGPARLFPDTGYRPPGLVAVASGKGGVGKTWLTVTLAHVLAARTRRVLLFDGDFGLANIDAHLGLIPVCDLEHVAIGSHTLHQAITPFVPGGFDVIAGRSGSGALCDITPGRLQLILDDLHLVSRPYDHVLIDLGAGLGRLNRAVTRRADTVVVVVSDEPASWSDAYAFMKRTLQEGGCRDLRVVVNAVNSQREGERSYRTIATACEGFLGYQPPLLGVVRRDSRVRDAIRTQTPLMIRSPNADAALDIQAIATRFLAPSDGG